MRTQNYREFLQTIGAQINEYQKTKLLEGRTSATDFNFLVFFGPGENKVSEILAFFLDPSASHGQGDRFLGQLLSLYNLEDLGAFKEVSCEKRISGDRRIDIYIEFENFVVAIENKIRAFDQKDQLQDYANFLAKTCNGRFLLLYLNPYGLEPGENSIRNKDLELLKEQGKIRIMSYNKDLFGLLDSWKSCCEAEKVGHFIGQFKDYLDTEINGKDSTMIKEIKDLIYQNPNEAAVLVSTYNDLKNSSIRKINEVAEIIKNDGISGFEEPLFVGPSNHENKVPLKRLVIFKAAVNFNGAKLWLQVLQDEIMLKTNYYEDDDFDMSLLEYLKSNNLDVVEEELKPELSSDLVAEDFKRKMKFVRELIENFPNHKEPVFKEADFINGQL